MSATNTKTVAGRALVAFELMLVLQIRPFDACGCDKIPTVHILINICDHARLSGAVFVVAKTLYNIYNIRKIQSHNWKQPLTVTLRPHLVTTKINFSL
jgi:hypothetical protein